MRRNWCDTKSESVRRQSPRHDIGTPNQALQRNSRFRSSPFPIRGGVVAVAANPLNSFVRPRRASVVWRLWGEIDLHIVAMLLLLAPAGFLGWWGLAAPLLIPQGRI